MWPKLLTMRNAAASQIAEYGRSLSARNESGERVSCALHS